MQLLKTMRKYLILILVFVGFSCDINQKEIKPEDEFLKIFNHQDEQLKFFPQSVTEIENSGYLVLSGVKSDSSDNEFPTSYIFSTDQQGELNWVNENNYLAPEGLLINNGSSVSYAAMDNQLNAIMVDIELGEGQMIGQKSLEMKMPLCFYKSSSGNILGLGFDFVNRVSRISLYNSSFDMIRTANLNINTDLQNLVQKHLNKSGKQYPFFIGEYSLNSGNGYFVNCFSNYTLRTVFLDEAGNLLNGNIYSFQTDAAISSLVQKRENMYALTRYYDGNNYLIPDIEVETGLSQNFNSEKAISLFELKQEASVRSMKIKKGDRESVLFASQSNSNSLLLYQYDLETDERLSIYEQNFNDRIEVCDMIQAKDEGIVVLGQIFVSGKFPRPFLIKVPAREFK